MLSSPFDAETEEKRRELFEDARKLLRAHGDVILDPNSRLELYLKVAVPDGKGLPFTAVPLPMPFMAHTLEGSVVDLKFLWLNTGEPFAIGGDVEDVSTPSLIADGDADWTLDPSVCFFGSTYNMQQHYASSSTRSRVRQRYKNEGYSDEGADRLSYESEELTWYDELVFVFFTTTTTTGEYEWRNGVLRLVIELSAEEKQKRVASWKNGRVERSLPNNSKLPDWKSAGTLRRAEAVFNMPVASASTFRVTLDAGIVGKRGRLDQS